MDILYIVGKNKSQWYDRELRYSLRSIERFGRNVGRVFVVGFPPAYLSKEVTTLRVDDPIDGVKHKNILACIDAAVKNLPISNEFLYSSDDHYYCKETDFDNYPIFCKGILPKEGKTPYRKSLAETRELLELCGLSVFNFSWHGNTHFYKDVWLSKDFQKLLEIQNKCTTQGVEPTCLMLNYYNKRVKELDFVTRADCKMFDFTQDEMNVKITADRECFSSDDGIENRTWLADYLKQMFPKLSKYERI